MRREHGRHPLVFGILAGMPWIAGTFALVVAGLALFFFTAAPPAPAKTIEQSYGADITFGPADAKVVLVEYADFQCAPCAKFATGLKDLRRTYGDAVLFVYRFYPLAAHRNAFVAAQVAYAAYRQGKFWEISDLLFQHQQDWADAADPSPYFDAYGTQIGLDTSTFHQDARAQETVDFINKQILEADKVGIGHTPSFFLNGTSIDPDGPDALGPLLRDRL